MNASEIEKLHDRFVDAALDQDWEKCDQIRALLKPSGILERPYTKECRGPGPRGLPYSRQNKTNRHRFMFYRMFDEERCMYCRCQLKKRKQQSPAQVPG